MDLEQRVKMLEQEVALLKGEIQAALLDIQEQLLTNAYPALRAEGSQPPDLSAPVAPAPRPAADFAPAMPEVETLPPVIRTVRLQPSDEDMAPPPASEPPVRATPVRQVLLDSLPASYQDETLSMQVPPPPTGGPDWAMFTHLAEWTANCIEEMGADRTVELVELYAERGVLSEASRAALLQTINLYSFYEQNGALEADAEVASEPRRGGRGQSVRRRRRDLIRRLIEGFETLSDGTEQSNG